MRLRAGLLPLLLLVGATRAAAQDAPSIENAIRLTGEADYKERLRGLEILESFPGDGRAVRAAVKLLPDADWGVGIRAAKALGKIGITEESRDPLIRMAVEGDIAWLRDAAAAALQGPEGKAAAARLLAAARSVKDTATQVHAVKAAGLLGDASNVVDLAGFTQSREVEVSAAALRAVGRIAGRDERARTEASSLLGNAMALRAERRKFRAYAAALEALGEIPTREATACLLGELTEGTDEDPYVTERVARGLALAGRPPFGMTLGGSLDGQKNPIAVRRIARVAGLNGIAEARPGLERALAHAEERVRSEACKALGLIGPPGPVEAVRGLLADRSPYVRREAVAALARLLPKEEFRALGATLASEKEEVVRLQWVVEIDDRRDPADLEALSAWFGDRSWRVASAALACAGTLGAAADLPRFQPLSSHKDWKVRAAAFEAMGRLRAKEAIPLLASGLRDRDPVTRGVCLANLQILTRQTLPADAGAWAAWWEKNGSGLDLVKKSRRDAAAVTTAVAEEDRYGKSLYGQRGVEVLQKARILVVTGAWDHVEKVLDHLKIPCTVLRAQQLKDQGLNPNQVVLVNCEGNVDSDSTERLQWFVNVGGYAMTTDWALTKAVRTCFPGFADQFPGANTGNDVVVVEEARPGHRYTAGVFDGVPAMKWWLEIQAFPIRVLYPERCEVLVDSAEMKEKYGSSTLGVWFRWGLGRVQHSVSHFALQEEGMTQARGDRARRIFAADHLGLSMEEIRDLAAKGGFEGSLNEATMRQIAPSYSMFRLIVNFVAEKSRWVEDL